MLFRFESLDKAEGKDEQAAKEDPVSAKIALLIGEGYPQDQAVAIAKSMERRGELHAKRGRKIRAAKRGRKAKSSRRRK